MIKKNTWYRARQDDKLALFYFLELDGGLILEFVIRNAYCQNKSFIQVNTLREHQFNTVCLGWRDEGITPVEIRKSKWSEGLSNTIRSIEKTSQSLLEEQQRRR